MLKIANEYIEWPGETGRHNRKKPFVIGVFGETPFGGFLEQVYNRTPPTMRIKNKIVKIQKINRDEQTAECHLVFVGGLTRRRLSPVIEFMNHKPILTVTDSEDYEGLGIQINLLLEKTGTTRLVINETTLRLSGLKIDDNLLGIDDAEIVWPFRPYQDQAKKLAPIAGFIEWPPGTAAADPSKPFKIEVLGQNFFESYLDRLFERKKLKNKPVVIRYISNVNEISQPHLLFISKSMKDHILEIIAYTRNKPILTIGDTPGFSQAGVHINFFYDELLKLSFEINTEAAGAADLDISYHLKKMAKTNMSH